MEPSPATRVTCCIAGCGPAGAVLGLLLARSGVDVLVLEKHGDFLRDFRGDTLHPSTLQLFDELGKGGPDDCVGRDGRASQALPDRNLANDPAKLVPILGALPPGTPVAFEAAYGWGWLVELLEELELEPHLVHPSRCKAIAFPSARKLCARAGLTPAVRNSDRTVRRGHVTKQG